MSDEVTNAYAVYIDIDESGFQKFLESTLDHATGEKVEVRVNFTNTKGEVTTKDFMLGEFLELLGFFK